MARTLEQILSEVSAKSDPQRQTVLSQIADAPTQLAADEAALNAKKDQGMEDINLGARRRGVSYWGAPIAEQQKYLATDYMPAVANLKTANKNKITTLQAALADIGRADYTTAQDIYGRDRSFEEQQRQFDTQLAESRRQAAASSGALSGLYGGGAAATAGQKSTVGTMAKKSNNGGYAFADQGGQSISAAKYAQLNGLNISQVLKEMGANGDSYAANAYNWMQKVQGMDMANTPQKMLALAQRNFAPLFWGL